MNQPSTSGLLALQGCVSSLNASLSTLGNSLTTLDTGIADFPRMQKLLTVNRHFELINESEVKDAQRDLADEVMPQIAELLKRAEQSLAKLERKQFALKSKVDDLGGELR